MGKRIHNFNAGPAVLPLSVLEEAQRDLLNFKDTGMSVMEMSHRSKEFEAVIQAAKADMIELMGIPETHEVLFLQGGASLQFGMIPLNLAQGKPVDVVSTGTWTKKAISDIKKLTECRIVASSESSNFDHIPAVTPDKIGKDAAYFYITTNNTIAGTQWHQFPNTGEVPLVADMSSDIMSRPIDVSQFGLIFAGAQKNLGPSGVTVVIIRKDLMNRVDEKVPTMLQYKIHAENDSLYNTPPTFGIYLLGLVLKWMKANGGLSAIQALNEKKAKLIYDVIDNSRIYKTPVQKESRSLMNIVFRVNNDEALESQFLKGAEAANLVGLKGHRSVGGMRASVYNACPLESVEALVAYMKAFEAKSV